MTTIRTLFQSTVDALKSADAQREATLFFRHYFQTPMIDWDATYCEADVNAAQQFVHDRNQHKPMSQILGYRDFWKDRFIVTLDVLDPRPDSETLIETALTLPKPKKILELGVGSGALVLSLLKEWPDATAVATDISSAAILVAGQNAENLGLADCIEFLTSDWFADVDGQFDLIISNPPYIAKIEMVGLEPSLQHEPYFALSDDADGLSAYRKIAEQAVDHLRIDGNILLEIGYSQADAVIDIFTNLGYPFKNKIKAGIRFVTV